MAAHMKTPADESGGRHSHKSETRISAIADFARKGKRKKKALPLSPRGRGRRAQDVLLDGSRPDRLDLDSAGNAVSLRAQSSPTGPLTAHVPRRPSRAHASRALVPGPDPGAAALLGRPGLHHPAALRHGGRRRHLPSGDHPARPRAKAVERRLRAALAPAEGRPLRREPEPAAALLPVPGDPETVTRRHPGPLSEV